MSLRAKGNLDPGQLDRRISLRYPIAARDAAGGEVVTWFEAATVWAKKTPLRGNRLFAAEAKHFEAELTYEIRHRSDVAEGWQLVHGDDAYEITAIAELGREARLELSCRGLDQSPAAAVRGFMLHSGDPFLNHSTGGFFLLHLESAA